MADLPVAEDAVDQDEAAQATAPLQADVLHPVDVLLGEALAVQLDLLDGVRLLVEHEPHALDGEGHVLLAVRQLEEMELPQLHEHLLLAVEERHGHRKIPQLRALPDGLQAEVLVVVAVIELEEEPLQLLAALEDAGQCRLGYGAVQDEQLQLGEVFDEVHLNVALGLHPFHIPHQLGQGVERPLGHTFGLGISASLGIGRQRCLLYPFQRQRLLPLEEQQLHPLNRVQGLDARTLQGVEVLLQAMGHEVDVAIVLGHLAQQIVPLVRLRQLLGEDAKVQLPAGAPPVGRADIRQEPRQAVERYLLGHLQLLEDVVQHLVIRILIQKLGVLLFVLLNYLLLGRRIVVMVAPPWPPSVPYVSRIGIAAGAEHLLIPKLLCPGLLRPGLLLQLVRRLLVLVEQELDLPDQWPTRVRLGHVYRLSAIFLLLLMVLMAADAYSMYVCIKKKEQKLGNKRKGVPFQFGESSVLVWYKSEF